MSRLGWISLSQQACCFAVECTNAISGFRSLCGLKQRSSFSLRARHDLPFLEPFTRRAPLARLLASPRYSLTGATTLNRCCGRNVVAPGQYSKRFFLVPAPFKTPFFAPRRRDEYRPDRPWAGTRGLILPHASMRSPACFGRTRPRRSERHQERAGPPPET